MEGDSDPSDILGIRVPATYDYYFDLWMSPLQHLLSPDESPHLVNMDRTGGTTQADVTQISAMRLIAYRL